MDNKKNKKQNVKFPPFTEEPQLVPIAKRVRRYFNEKLIADCDQVMLKRRFPMVYFFPTGMCGKIFL